MKDRKNKYWVVTASKDHVKNGIAQGIAQTCHGKAAPLKRMRKDDYIIYYSGLQTMGKPEKSQQFTAIGKVIDDEIYQHQVSQDFCPSRRNINFLDCNELSILPMINNLQFIQDKQRWGFPFRFGILEINKHDFDLISSQMLIL